MKQQLKQHYDGYHFSENMLDIYNPFSLLNCFDSMAIQDYWFASGTYSPWMKASNSPGFWYFPSEFVSSPSEIH